MTDPNSATIDMPAVANGNGNGLPAADVLDELRGLYDDLIADEARKFPLPGFRDKVWSEYRILEPHEWREIGEVASENDHPEAITHMRVDVLTRACSGVYRLVGDDDFEPVEKNGRTLRFEPALADVFGWDGAAQMSARDVFLKLVKHMTRVASHYKLVTAWMEDGEDVGISVRQALEGRLAGE